MGEPGSAGENLHKHPVSKGLPPNFVLEALASFALLPRDGLGCKRYCTTLTTGKCWSSGNTTGTPSQTTCCKFCTLQAPKVRSSAGRR